MSYPDVVSREAWLAARKALLAEEKAMTKARDALSTKRRELPMVRIDKDYVFEEPSGELRLINLFEGRRQLIIQHFMVDPEWADGCPSCTAASDEISAGLLLGATRVQRVPPRRRDDLPHVFRVRAWNRIARRLLLLPRFDRARAPGRLGRAQRSRRGSARPAARLRDLNPFL